MAMVGRKQPCAVVVEIDETPLNPRKKHDNLGTMVCWHGRHILGDKQPEISAKEFFRLLILESTGNAEKKKIIKRAQEGEFPSMSLKYNNVSRKWELEWKGKYTHYLPSPMESYRSAIFKTIIYGMDLDELCLVMESIAVMLPLYLYDHTGITMNTTGFSCKLDSGQVGHIYMTHSDIRDECGKISPESIAWAKGELVAEVIEYDYYLQGQCYQFTLYEHGEEIDSGGGFFGYLQDVLPKIREQMPYRYESMLDNMEEIDASKVSEYIEKDSPFYFGV